MPPIVYGQDFSPPTRAVYMTAKHIGLELEIKDINLFQEEPLDPDFLKINPKHSIPTLDDDGFVLTDGHAISAYLVGKYSKDEALYPKCLRQRALIDQMLHFDTNLLLPVILLASNIYDTVPTDLLDSVYKAYTFLEQFLKTKDFVAGKNISIADFHLYTTITAANVVAPFIKDHTNINKWLNRCSKLSLYDNSKGISNFQDFFITNGKRWFASPHCCLVNRYVYYD